MYNLIVGKIYFIVIQWCIRSYLIESQWNMTYPVWKCLAYRSPHPPYYVSKLIWVHYWKINHFNDTHWCSQLEFNCTAKRLIYWCCVTYCRDCTVPYVTFSYGIRHTSLWFNKAKSHTFNHHEICRIPYASRTGLRNLCSDNCFMMPVKCISFSSILNQ